MWPRLVANKVLRKRSGSSNFVADAPTTTTAAVDALLPELIPADDPNNAIFAPHHAKHTSTTYRVFVSTWNVGGIVPHDDLDMEEILDTCNSAPCDIYVLGFQEVVPLITQNVLGWENEEVCGKWNSLIRKALNKKKNNNNNDDDENLLGEEGGLVFRCIMSKQMVGILITVWAPTYLCAYIRHPNVSCIGCGIFGCLGNKGSVSVRFQLHKTSFCFVCSHLASGGTQRDERNRNSDLSDIFTRTTFPTGGLYLNLPKTILNHDRVIFLGDLNYRISLPEEITRLLVETRDWNSLLENDQLRMQLMKGEFLGGWKEGNITFPPTYKYQLNSDLYFGLFQPKTGQKRRSPAWCDRIIWFGEGMKQQLYTRCETKLSDHRPVKGIFETEVGMLNTIKELESLLLSNRFETISSRNHLQLSETHNNNFICNGRPSL